MGNKKGFTLVELVLAMAFISFLLIGIALSTIQMMKTYNRGLTLKSVNQAGRDVGDLLRRDSFVAKLPDAHIVKPADGNGSLGRMCLGSYSYLWGDPGITDETKKPKYNTGEVIVLARVVDRGAEYCAQDKDGNYKKEVIKSTNSQEGATELLQSIQGDLAVYDISVTSIKPKDQMVELYSIAYTIGTGDAGAIDTTNQSCKPPGDMASNFDFCAVNQFEILVLVG